MTNLTDVIARLETWRPAAQDQAVLVAIEYARSQGWIDEAEHERAMTFWGVGALLDAALTLVPEGYSLAMLAQRSQPEMGGRMWSARLTGAGDVRSSGQFTPALALCIAALRAREAG